MTSDLFAGDTHASLSASLVNGVAQKTTVTSGLKCLGLSKSSGPLGSLEKMLLGTSRWASTKCSLTWKEKATPQGRLLFQLVPLTLHTDEIESGLLHTPTAHNAKETAAPSEYERNTPTLAAQAGGSLNPAWVEWLMGFPIGHTDLNSLETR